MLKRYLTWASWGYLGALLLLPLVWGWKGERQWLLAFLRYSPALAYALPIALLALLSILLRNRASCLPLLASLMLVFSLYAAPVLSFERQGNGSLRVLTYNILGGRMARRDQLASFLREQNANLILLQEVSRPSPLEGYSMVEGGDLAIYSRFPIMQSRQFSLASRRPALWADISVNGRRVRVVNVHYDHFDQLGDGRVRTLLRASALARARQTDQLLRELSHWGGPVVLGGDFNSPPGSDTPARLRADLQDTYATVGTGLGQTFPSFFPLWRIDYIYASEHFRVCRSAPVEVMLSDHRPVRAELELDRP